MKREELEKELKDKFKDFNIIYRDALNGTIIYCSNPKVKPKRIKPPQMRGVILVP